MSSWTWTPDSIHSQPCSPALAPLVPMPTFSSPTHPLQSPSTILTFPPVRTQSRSTGPGQREYFALKIKISPKILLPPHLISARTTGRRLEDCIEAIVPLSGAVRIKVDITLPIDHSREQDIAEARIADDIKLHIKDQIEQVHSARDALGLSDIEEEDPTEDEHESDLCLRAWPISSSSVHHALLTHLLPIGQPLIHLQQIDLSFSWSQVDLALVASTEVEMPIEDMDVVDLGIDMDLPSSPQAYDEDGSREEIGHPLHLDQSIPQWLKQQLQLGVQKVLRIHFVKRFPLIFDAACLRYFPAFTPHRSMIMAISAFSRLSKRPRCAFHERLMQSLGLMMDALDNHVLVQADFSVRLQRTAKRPKSKRAPADLNTQNSSKSSKSDIESNKEKEEELAPECRLERHMAVRADRINKLDCNNDRWVMAVLLEALGIIGRTKWRDSRSSGRKMSANKIQLFPHESDRLHVTESQSTHQAQLIAALEGDGALYEEQPRLLLLDHMAFDVDASEHPDQDIQERLPWSWRESAYVASPSTHHSDLDLMLGAEADDPEDQELDELTEREPHPDTPSLLLVRSSSNCMPERAIVARQHQADDSLLADDIEEDDFWHYCENSLQDAWPPRADIRDDYENEFEPANTLIFGEQDEDNLNGSDQLSGNTDSQDGRTEYLDDDRLSSRDREVLDEPDYLTYTPSMSQSHTYDLDQDPFLISPCILPASMNTPDRLDTSVEEDLGNEFDQPDAPDAQTGEPVFENELEDDCEADAIDEFERVELLPAIQQGDYFGADEALIDDLDIDFDFCPTSEYAFQYEPAPYASKVESFNPHTYQYHHIELSVFDDLDL